LQAHCVELLFRSLLEKGEEGQLLKEIRQEKERNKRDSALYELYKLWQFDLAQFDLRKKEKDLTFKG
jgi:hypothetical protein